MSSTPSAIKQVEEKLTASAHKTAALVSTTASASSAVSKRVTKLHTSVNQVKAGAPATSTDTSSLTLEQKVDIILAEQLEQKAIIGRLNYTVAQELQKLQTQQADAANNTSNMNANLQAQIKWLGDVLDVFHADTITANTNKNTGNVLTNAFKRKNKNTTNTTTTSSTTASDATTTPAADATADTTDPASTSVAPAADASTTDATATDDSSSTAAAAPTDATSSS